MNKKNYVNDRELTYEIVVSKGKGKITNRLNEMLYLILKRYIPSIAHNNNIFEVNDLINYTYIILNKNILKFNELKYEKSLPFITQLIKNAVYLHYSKMILPQKKDISIDKFYTV